MFLLSIPIVAQVIVESNFKDFNVAPSQGSHFFQNLTFFKVGYFTVDSKVGEGFINWNRLREQNHIREIGAV